jgi:predicted phage-related endonuclease
MIIHQVKQGSEAWKELRGKYHTASNAPNMMGEGYDSRDKSLRYALGIEQKVITPELQDLFALGHDREEKARPSAAVRYDVKLKPLVASLDVDGLPLLASFDGINEQHDFIWEHKYTSKSFDEIPPLYFWQLEHQLLVAGADFAVLTVTSRKDESLSHYEYESRPDRREQLIEGWKKWEHDLENYERTDSDWVVTAKEYRSIKTQIDELTAKQKKLGQRLHEMAGNHSAAGAGLKVSVSEQWEQKQTPAAYIKEHGIALPVTKLEQPKLNYRITLEK